VAIKFEKLQPGMVLYDRHRERMGNTTMSRMGEWRVRVISIDAERRQAVVSWNGSPPKVWYERQLCRLSAKSAKDLEEQRAKKAASR